MKSRFMLQMHYFLVLLLIGGIYAAWVKITGLAVPCPFHLLTGLKCPGCGVTRMCMAFLEGDIRRAIQYNVGIVVCAPFGLVLAVKWEARYLKTGKRDFAKSENRLLWGMVVFLVLFGIVRNFIGL